MICDVFSKKKLPNGQLIKGLHRFPSQSFLSSEDLGLLHELLQHDEGLVAAILHETVADKGLKWVKAGSTSMNPKINANMKAVDFTDLKNKRFCSFIQAGYKKNLVNSRIPAPPD